MFGIKWMKGPASLARTVIVMVMSFCLTLSGFTPVFASEGPEAQTKMKHSPPKYFVSDHRIQMDAEVADPSGVELVRCYFRGSSEADFVFVPMSATKKNKYSGILPAPSAATEQIEYLFLAVNAENQIVKSQIFTIDREERETEPAWQEIPMEGDIQVSMELDQVPNELAGFSDNIAMNAVESGARFGVAAGGIYYLAAGKTASVSGTAAAATTTGTVTAGTAGISTLGLVGIGAAATLSTAAVGAAAAGGDSGGGSDLPGGTGEVKVTLQWNDCNDLDLHVTDPCGNVINYQNPTATCQGKTGRLDLDANVSQCRQNPAENIYWTSAPSGTYTVAINYFRGTGSSSYTVTVINRNDRSSTSGSISSGSKTIRSFTF